MQPPQKENDEEFLLTFSDLLSLAKRNSRKIRNGAVVFALIALCFALSRPVEYEARGTFKDKAKSQSGISENTTAALFLISDPAENNAIAILSSRKLKEALIKEEGLQGVILKDEPSFPLIPLKKIKNHLMAEMASLFKMKDTILEEAPEDLKITAIEYPSEIRTTFKIETLDDNAYEVFDGNGLSLGKGAFGDSFTIGDTAFTLQRLNPKARANSSYVLTLLPLSKTADDFCKKFVIETDKNDKNLVKITHYSPNRLQASRNINLLMELYQKHIQCEHENLCGLQIDYLVKRQNEMGKQLEQTMQAHANELSSDLSTTGFATSEKAMEFLAASQQQLKQKLFMTNLEIQRLENAQKQNSSDADSFSSLNTIDAFNKLAYEKRLLRQEADSLDLALRNLPEVHQNFHETFTKQLEDLEGIKQALKESDLIIEQIYNDEIPSGCPTLSGDPKFSVKDWNDRLASAKQTLEASPHDAHAMEALIKCKEGYLSYLGSLNHFLNVHQRNIEERLSRQQAPSEDFQGINLGVGKDLYMSFNKELSQTESQIGQQEFILEQIDAPDFEVSSLSTVLNDPVSNELITKISSLTLALKDQDNRSSKEQERLQAELAIQKGFLTAHIKQSTSLLGLRKQFIKDKIRQLQSTNLSLIQEEISILDNETRERIAVALESLEEEKLLLQNNLTELRIEMASFPQKWAAEQLINQQMEINKTLVKEISSLVVSKNIANNLEKFQSAPVDTSYPSIHPKPPRLLLLTIIGAIAGAFFTFIWTLGQSIFKGIPLSEEALRSAGMHVSGTLSKSYNLPLDAVPPLDTDLATLRRLAAYFGPFQKNSTLLLLEGAGPAYALAFAELLLKMDIRPVVVDLRFQDVSEEGTDGMLQYLNGSMAKPAIVKKGNVDWIPSGGISRYANELVGTPRFISLLETLVKSYDLVIVCSDAAPESAEADSLLKLFPCSAVSAGEEPVQSLRTCLAHARNPETKTSFILYGS